MEDSGHSNRNAIRYKEQHCPSCNHILDAATHIENDEVIPSEGDYSICMYCGEILRFGKDQELILATQEDLENLIDVDMDVYDQLVYYQNKIKSNPFK